MKTYEIIQKQSKEVLTRTITDFIALYLMSAVMYGVPTDYEFLRKEVAKELDSEDFASNEERQWKIHPDGFGQYCLNMMVYEMKKAKKEVENK